MAKVKALFSAISLMTAVIFSGPAFGQMQIKNDKAASIGSAAMLKTNMRKVWEDHVIWTRNVIFCLVDGLPGTDQAVKRLLQNQVDIQQADIVFIDDAGDLNQP